MQEPPDNPWDYQVYELEYEMRRLKLNTIVTGRTLSECGDCEPRHNHHVSPWNELCLRIV
jgi:hypothetical protein